MSSILQSSGKWDRHGRHQIFLTLERPVQPGVDNITDSFICPECGREHENVYFIYRRPVDMLGQFVRFRLNGSLWPLDLSLPTRVDKLPPGATLMPVTESVRYWHSS